MTDEELLAAAVNPDGSRRFYPSGQHPATAQLRAALARAEEFDDGQAVASEYIEHVRGELARFEAGEAAAQRRYLEAVRNRLESTVRDIAGQPCERLNAERGCFDGDPSWRFDAEYGADRVCAPCHARRALRIERNPGFVKRPPESESVRETIDGPPEFSTDGGLTWRLGVWDDRLGAWR